MKQLYDENIVSVEAARRSTGSFETSGKSAVIQRALNGLPPTKYMAPLSTDRSYSQTSSRLCSSSMSHRRRQANE